MTIKEPLLGQLNQGSIFSCAKAERYPDCPIYGLVLTARCDLEQDKYNVLNYAPAVPLRDWLKVDGYELVLSRASADSASRIASALKTIDLPLSILSSQTPASILETYIRADDADKKLKRAETKFVELDQRVQQLARWKQGYSADNRDLFEHCETIVQNLVKELIHHRLAGYYFLPRLEADSEDKGFVFTIFRFYHEYLSSAGQFDTDDVVLTTIGQLDTPIWRRRRTRDGYDAVLIDETHLFNINELQLFHYFTRIEGPYPIAYSVDRSQAVGDKGWSTEDIASNLLDSGDSAEQSEVVRTVFRSSPDIVNLAFAILASGATLFTNFDNPMEAAASGFTEAEERLCAEPIYYHAANEQALIEGAFERAEALQKDLGCRRSDILIVSLNSNIVTELTEYARNRNKPAILLTRRGDATAVGAAREASQWVLGHADFVGGLEFHGVIIVGVDGGRVPPTANDEDSSSKSFLSYVSHNRLYVAVSRARYRVELLGEKARGPSRLVAGAIDSGLLAQRDI
ncbi:DEAD/DEAH box helicase [Bradyrhizobium ottawaense]|uniref:hypothetical protein n=1 Tax=Bradyrhizobium ottawaense TaxID=931866 RepID=UPI0038378775